MRDALEAVCRGADLTEARATELMDEVMAGTVSPVVTAALLAALRTKGETVDEIVGFARAVRLRCPRFPLPGAGLVDTCGTGGDGAGSFNVSTTAAFIAAGAGARVAKHGNRAVSSRTGSADVLAALGADIELDGLDAADVLRTTGLAFLYAPLFHAAMRHVAPVRKELGVRTVFNLLGPLCNPAGAESQLVGVFDGDLVRPVAETLARLGATRAMVVHGRDGLDELSVAAPTRVAEFDGDDVREYEIDAQSLGLARRTRDEIRGGDADENARLLRAALDPAHMDDARRDVALLNAAAALRVAGIAGDLGDGLERARESVYSGAALARLDAFCRETRARRGAGARPALAEPPVPVTVAGWAR